MADEILWPLRAVSKEPSNVTELDTDGRILTDRNRISDAFVGTFVMTAGDTITGPLVVELSSPTGMGGGLSVVGSGAGGMGTSTVLTYSDTPNDSSVFRMRRWRGTKEAPLSVQEGDRIGAFAFAAGGPSGAAVVGCGNLTVSIQTTPQAGDTTANVAWDWTIQGRERVAIFHLDHTAGYLFSPVPYSFGLNWTTPTHQLEVGGTTMLRGTLDVTGNITCTGTAHAFASKSIPGMAVIGSAATAITAATPGSAGGIRWDEDFLYIRTATAWKKIPLSAV